jgi:hypothetical protein
MTINSLSVSRRIIGAALVAVVCATTPLIAQDASAAEHIPYQSVVNMTGKCTAQNPAVCSFYFGAIPRGHRLVVQEISGLVSFTTPPDSVSVSINAANGELLQGFMAPAVNYSETGFIQPTLLYVDADKSFSVQITAPGPGQFVAAPTVQFVSVVGYLIDCYREECPEVVR